jgi:glycosyltransferase involved in cell wall biosynthesis
VSVFTAAYQTGERILRPYQSLLAQTYTNWEWVVMDDSEPGDATHEIVSALADHDHRVRVFRSDRHCGVIGEIKRRCCGLARGEVLVELDHDDELTVNCLADVVEAFATFPDAGFAYTDCAEVFESGLNATYGDSFAFHFGTYRDEEYGGRVYNVMDYPDINAKTVRHIVSMPNHVRAWTREGYAAAGGHSPDVHVADDFELCLRTFLTTRMIHIKRFGYIQHLGDGGENTQRRRNAEIQRLVRYFAGRYEDRIHQRFEELGVDDFIWTENGRDWSREPGTRPITANYVLP